MALVQLRIAFWPAKKEYLAFKNVSENGKILVFLNLDNSTVSINHDNKELNSFENIFNKK
jgi:hypothetical protein